MTTVTTIFPNPNKEKPSEILTMKVQGIPHWEILDRWVRKNK